MGPKIKNNIFGQESTYHQGENFKKSWGMSVSQNLGIILESKVVQKSSLEKKSFY